MMDSMTVIEGEGLVRPTAPSTNKVVCREQVHE